MAEAEKVEAVEKLKKEIEELKNDYQNKMFDISKDFCGDWSFNDLESSDYICDAFHDCADNNIDIYYSDLFEWCKNNFEYVNRAQQEFGASGDIIQDIRAGQYLDYSEKLYTDENEIVRVLALYYLEKNINEIVAQKLAFNWDAIDDALDEIDANNRFCKIKDVCDECLGLDGAAQNE